MTATKACASRERRKCGSTRGHDFLILDRKDIGVRRPQKYSEFLPCACAIEEASCSSLRPATTKFLKRKNWARMHVSGDFLPTVPKSRLHKVLIGKAPPVQLCRSIGAGALSMQASVDKSSAGFWGPWKEPLRDSFLKHYGGRLLGGVAEDADDYDPEQVDMPGDALSGEITLSGMLMAHCLVAGLTAVLFGFDMGASSGALLNLITFQDLPGSEYMFMNPWLQGFVVSSAWIGNVSGGFLGYWLVPTSRDCLIYAAGMNSVGGLLITLSPSLEYLVLGRLICGVGNGLSSLAIGQYTAEIAPPSVRGGAIAVQETTLVSGAILGSIISRMYLWDEDGYRSTWGMVAPLGLVTFAMLQQLPETPRTIYAKAMAAGRQSESEVPDMEWRTNAMMAAREESERVMCRIRGLTRPDQAVIDELAGIERAIEQGHARRVGAAASTDPAAEMDESSGTALSLPELLRSDIYRHLLFVAAVVQSTPALVAHSALLNYATQIFQKLGYDVADGSSLTIGIYVLKLACTVPDFVWLDRYGRRPLMQFTLLGSLVSWSLATLAVPLGMPGLAAASLLGTAVFYQIAVGPLTWIVSSEIFPQQIKMRGNAFSAIVYAMSNAFIVQLFPLMLQLGPTVAFSVASMTTASAFLLNHAFLPETFGRTLEEIESDIFARRLFRPRRPLQDDLFGFLPPDSSPEHAGEAERIAEEEVEDGDSDQDRRGPPRGPP